MKTYKDEKLKKKSIFSKNYFKAFLVIILIFTGSRDRAYGQAEVEPWGNIKGIRLDGQLMEFESSLQLIGKNWNTIKATGKEKQRPKYKREGKKQIVTTNIDSLFFIQETEDVGSGDAKVKVKVTSRSDESLEGVFFSVRLPSSYFSKGNVQLDGMKAMPISVFESATPGNSAAKQAAVVRLTSPERQLELVFNEATPITIKKKSIKGTDNYIVYFPIHEGDIKKGAEVQKEFTIKASGKIDKKPIILKLNTAQTGRAFAGLGGNFRLQNIKTDPQVIDYCLNNLRVAYGRVEMPWRFWHPVKDSSPSELAKSGKMHPLVQRSMEMAQRLGKKNIPLILSAWSAPAWAIVGAPKFRPGPDGVWGNPLDKDSINEIYKSIGDYVVYLKENYGVEVAMFSFNESDLGINIRQTGEEHADLIKGLGAHFASRGLKTKMLLGDNSDATTYEFIYPAMNDPQAIPFIGAVSFHSWRGWETEILEKWAQAAQKLNVPLIVGEGSIDAAAWNYPKIFEEQTYALEEINLYTRLLAICQPLSILQWQLTADYSPLSGGGIFGDDGPLRPTQRFWNLKQLASTPEGLLAMPITSDRADISCAAYGNNSASTYAIHLVNNGPARAVTLSGLPNMGKPFKVLVTDKVRNMKEEKKVSVKNGQIKFTVDEVSYTTLLSE